MTIFRHSWTAPAAAVGFVWFLSMGCSTATARVSKPVEPVPPTPTAREESWQYRIQPSDELAVKLFYHPSLNEQVTVRPDGRISLQLVGEVVAADATAQELTELLKVRYGDTLEKPEVSVIVRTFSGQRIFVAGEVGRPGEQPLVGRTTALQAVAQAQGFKDTAKLTEVLVIRRNADYTPYVMVADLKKVVSGIDMSNDVVLMPYDVVFVPRSMIADVNKFVREFITNNLPFDFGFRVDLYR